MEDKHSVNFKRLLASQLHVHAAPQHAYTCRYGWYGHWCRACNRLDIKQTMSSFYYCLRRSSPRSSGWRRTCGRHYQIRVSPPSQGHLLDCPGASIWDCWADQKGRSRDSSKCVKLYIRFPTDTQVYATLHNYITRSCCTYVYTATVCISPVYNTSWSKLSVQFTSWSNKYTCMCRGHLVISITV